MNSFQWFFQLANKMTIFKGFLASDFKGDIPFSASLLKMNKIEHISMKSSKLKKYEILGNFQKTALYRSGLNEQNEQFSVKFS